MLTPREKAIAGFALAAGAAGFSIAQLREALTKVEAAGKFDEPQLSETRELAKQLIDRHRKG